MRSSTSDRQQQPQQQGQSQAAKAASAAAGKGSSSSSSNASNASNSNNNSGSGNGSGGEGPRKVASPGSKISRTMSGSALEADANRSISAEVNRAFLRKEYLQQQLEQLQGQLKRHSTEAGRPFRTEFATLESVGVDVSFFLFM